MDAFSFMDQAHDHLTGFLLSVDYEIPGVFQGVNKNVQDTKVGNFTSVFFRTSYSKSESV